MIKCKNCGAEVPFTNDGNCDVCGHKLPFLFNINVVNVKSNDEDVKERVVEQNTSLSNVNAACSSSLVLGIINIFFGSTLFMPVIGIAEGVIGLKEISYNDQKGRGAGIAGIVINSLLLLFYSLFYIIMALAIYYIA